MNSINFTGRNNFPLAIETMTFLQSIIQTTGVLFLIGGDNYILSGCKTNGLTVSSGYVVINGEILPFTGGTVQEYVYIKEQKRTVIAQMYIFADVYNERTVEFGYADTKYKWEDFKRVSTNIQLAEAIESINTTVNKLSGFPVGAMLDFAGQTGKIPADFMLCDGRLLNREEYPALFDVLGYLHGGSGDSFALPLTGGRATLGYDENDTDYNQVGKRGGQKERVITKEQLPDHDHFMRGSNADNGDPGDLVVTAFSQENQGIRTDKAGNNQPLDMRQPYIVTPKIIKVR